MDQNEQPKSIERIDDVETIHLHTLQTKLSAFMEFLAAKYQLGNGSQVNPVTGIITRQP